MNRVRSLLLACAMGLLLGFCVGLSHGSREAVRARDEPAVFAQPLMDGNYQVGSWSATVAPGPIPAHMLSLTSGCGPLHAWATARSAIPRGRATVGFTVQAPPDRSLVIQSVRVVRGKKLPKPSGRDVGCVGSTSGPGATAFNLDLDQTLKKRPFSRYVRPGGVTGGLVDVTTSKRSCEWWIELEILDGGKPRTMRIVDNDGRPFTVAPPVPAMSTVADRAATTYAPWTIPLTRPALHPPAVSGRFSARGFWTNWDQVKPSWTLSTPREVPSVRPLAADMDVPGEGCDRLQRELMARGAHPTGRSFFEASLASSTATSVIAEVTLNIERVRPLRPGVEYGCSAGEVEPGEHGPPTTVSLAGATKGTDLLVTHDRLDVSTSGASASSTADGYGGGRVPPFTILPGNAEYSFTVSIRVTDINTGAATTLELTDEGKPFVVRGRSDSGGHHTYHEAGSLYH
jgi:hypothetical protein